MKHSALEKKSNIAVQENHAGEKRDITIDDLFSIKMLNSPEISPDGERIVFTYKWTDLKANTYYSNLYMADLKRQIISQFTSGEQQDSYPLWSPDGNHIIFRRERDNKKGLWLISANGGEAIPFVIEKGSIGEYIWSPDSKKIAYTFRKPDPPPPLSHISNDSEYKVTGDEKPYHVIDTIPYKTKSGEIKPKGKFHIYLIDIVTKETTQLSYGDRDDSGLAFSPDGSKLAFCSNRDSDPIHEYENNDIYIYDFDTKTIQKITSQWGPKVSPGWSPDGKFIFFTGHHAPRGKSGEEDYKIYKIPSSGGDTTLLTKDFDGHVSNMLIGDTREFDDVVQMPLFIESGRKILFCASYHGGCYFYEVPSEGGIPQRIDEGKHEVIYYSQDKKRENIAVLRGDMLTPSEVYHYKKTDKGWKITQITKYNEFLKTETNIEEPEEIWFTTSKGVKLQGWLIKPPGFDQSKKYPLIHEIHGGPQILYGYCFFHEMHYFAANGYCVLFINPQGSRGYGSSFTGAIHGKWGIPDTVDQMEFLDHIINRDYIDVKNLFLIGGSYGGYMTNWLITQTDRYAAAVSLRSVANLASHFGMSCGCFHFEHTFGGVPWRDIEHYRRTSPLYYVENVKTPLLIAHSEKDNLTPIGEAEQFFVALKYLGKKARFLRFNDENHELSRGGRPTNRRARLELILEWFEEHRKK